MARQEVNKAQREDRGLEPQAAFQGATYWWDQRRKCSPVTWAWITAFAPHPCHGQFLVIQTRTGEKLSDKPWSLLCDKISSRFLRAKRFGYQAFLKKSSCTLVPTVPGETKLTVLLSFRPNQEGRCEGKQWGNKSLPPNQKVPSCSLLKVDRHPYLVVSSQQGQHNSSCYSPWSGCKSTVWKVAAWYLGVQKNCL